MSAGPDGPVRGDRFLRLPAVIRMTGLSRSTIYRRITERCFPAQVKLSERCAGWRESQIEAWLADPAAFRTDRTDTC